MKIFITFLAMLMLNIMFLIYQSDMNIYSREQNYVKAVAEECAAGAALYYEEIPYSIGVLKFNREEAEKHVQYIIDFSFEEEENASYKIDFFEEPETLVPKVNVNISISGKDYFRLSFLTKKEIVREASYELKTLD